MTCETRESLGENWPKGRKDFIKHKYHISKQQYIDLHIAQEGLCWTCNEPANSENNQCNRFLCIDHM